MKTSSTLIQLLAAPPPTSLLKKGRSHAMSKPISLLSSLTVQTLGPDWPRPRSRERISARALAGQ